MSMGLWAKVHLLWLLHDDIRCRILGMKEVNMGLNPLFADNCSCSLNIDGQNKLQLFWCPLIQRLLGAQCSPHSLKASSWDCVSHRVSTARDGAVWSSCSCFSPSDSNYSVSKTVRGNVDWNHPPWSGTMKPCVWVILQQEVLVRNMELTSHHQLEEFGKGQKETPHVLPASQNPPHWDYSWLSNAQAKGRILNQDDWQETSWKLIPWP